MSSAEEASARRMLTLCTHQHFSRNWCYGLEAAPVPFASIMVLLMQTCDTGQAACYLQSNDVLAPALPCQIDIAKLALAQRPANVKVFEAPLPLPIMRAARITSSQCDLLESLSSGYSSGRSRQTACRR